MATKTRFVQCQRCKGKGWAVERVQNRGTLEWNDAIVHCVQLACHNGTVDMDEYYRAIS